jgi:hypothetical protein
MEKVNYSFMEHIQEVREGWDKMEEVKMDESEGEESEEEGNES